VYVELGCMISGAHDDGMARGPVWNLSSLFSLVCSPDPFGVGGSLECQQRIRRLSRRI
jgi:hypothetical protein